MTCLWGGDEIFAGRVRDGWNVFAARPLLNDWRKNDLHFARPVGPTSDVAKAVLGSPIIQACHSLVEKISTSRAPFGWKSVLLPLVTRENNVSVLWQCFGFCTTDFGCPWSANQLYKNPNISKRDWNLWLFVMTVFWKSPTDPPRHDLSIVAMRWDKHDCHAMLARLKIIIGRNSDFSKAFV